MLYDLYNNIIVKEYNAMHADADGKLSHDAFMCPFCLKIFFDDYKDLRKWAKRHASHCRFNLSEGINVIDGTTIKDKKVAGFIDRFGRLSKNEQRIDFPMTDSDSVKKLNQRVFVYVLDRKPLGMLTIDKRRIQLEKGLTKEFISCTDFYVIHYVQRQGIGKMLFNSMLNFYKLNPKDLAYCRPTQATLNFLKKWYDINVKDLVCW